MTGYYTIDKEGLFTESSPYRYNQEAVSEAKEIHGDNFDINKHVEIYQTDAFDGE